MSRNRKIAFGFRKVKTIKRSLIITNEQLKKLHLLPQLIQDNGATFSVESYVEKCLRYMPPSPIDRQFHNSKELQIYIPSINEVRPLQKIIKKLNVEKFTELIKQRLDKNVRGYHVEVMQGSKTVASISDRFARVSADRVNNFNGYTKMHLSGTSSFLTAIALIKVLAELSISITTPIRYYLPAYWNLSEHNKNVTFYHLLTHTSGFRRDTSVLYYADVKNILMSGNWNIGVFQHCNANYGVIRILLPILIGAVDKQLYKHWDDVAINLRKSLLSIRETLWDSMTILAFKEYINKYIFRPARVKPCITDPNKFNNKAYGYRSADDKQKGMNSGDLAGTIGCIGFRLTAKEYVNILSKFMSGNGILKRSYRKNMLASGYGIYGVDTIRGVGYRNSGAWFGNDCAEESSIYILPDKVYITGYCSSEPKTVQGGLEGSILDAYNYAMTD